MDVRFFGTSHSKWMLPLSAARTRTPAATSAPRKSRSTWTFIPWHWRRRQRRPRSGSGAANGGSRKFTSALRAIPGILVDAVVEEPTQQQFYGLGYDPSISGARRAHLAKTTAAIPGKLERRIIARRAALELAKRRVIEFRIWHSGRYLRRHCRTGQVRGPLDERGTGRP